jgi:hypothetical protein
VPKVNESAPPSPVRVEYWSMAKQCEMNGQKEWPRNGYGGQAKVTKVRNRSFFNPLFVRYQWIFDEVGCMSSVVRWRGYEKPKNFSPPPSRGGVVIRQRRHSGRACQFRARPGIQEASGKSNHSGSRLASRSAELGRDDKWHHSLLRVRKLFSQKYRCAARKPGEVHFIIVTNNQGRLTTDN